MLLCSVPLTAPLVVEIGMVKHVLGSSTFLMAVGCLIVEVHRLILTTELDPHS